MSRGIVSAEELTEFRAFAAAVARKFTSHPDFAVGGALTGLSTVGVAFLIGPVWTFVILCIGFIGVMAFIWNAFRKRRSNSEPRPVTEVKITTRDESGNPIYSSRQVQELMDISEKPQSVRRRFNGDAEEEENSTIPERNGLHASFHRTPLTPQEWSAVTSPGFSSRVVRAAEGKQDGDYSVFRNHSYNVSPFQKSPNRSLGLGQIPYGSKWKKPLGNPPRLVSPSPGISSVRSYAKTYIPTRRGDSEDTSVYLKIAPIDHEKSYLNMSQNSSGPPVDNGESNKSGYGLGGTLPGSITNKMSRLWPSANNSVYESSTTSITPTILEALNNRKRTRANSESTYDRTPTKCPPGVSSMTISPEEIPKNSKRLKFINTDEDHRSLSTVPLTSYHTSQDESMTTESILEQMNQTEKRFLPDDDSPPPRPLPKRQRGSSTPHAPPHPRASSTPISSSSQAYRKRRVSPGSRINIQEEEEDGKEKLPRFCTCTECYNDAAGVKNGDSSPLVSVSNEPSSTQIQENQQKKKVTFSSEVNNKMVGEVITTPARPKPKPYVTLTSPAFSPRSPLANLEDIIDKKKYEHDKRLKLLRLSKILDINLENTKYAKFVKQQTETVTPAAAPMTSFAGPEANTPSTSTTPVSSGFSFGGPSTVSSTVPPPTITTMATPSAGFSFGDKLTTTTSSGPITGNTGSTLTSGGFSFGAGSTSPAPVTTSAAPTITTTAASSGGFSFGAPTSTAASPALNFSSPTTQPSTPVSESMTDSGNFAQPTSSASVGGFSFGAKLNQSSPAAAVPTTATAVAPLTPKVEFGGFTSSSDQLTSTNSTGIAPVTTTSSAPTPFTFGQTATSTAAPAGLPPSYSESQSTPAKTTGFTGFGDQSKPIGFGTPASAVTTTAASPFAYGQTSTAPTISTPTPSAAPVAVSTPGFGFGASTSTPIANGNASGFSFGGPSATSTPTTSAAGATSGLSAAQPFSFGQPTAAPAPATPNPASPFAFGKTESSTPSILTPGGANQSRPSTPVAGFGFGNTTPNLGFSVDKPANSTSAFGLTSPLTTGSSTAAPTLSQSGSTGGFSFGDKLNQPTSTFGGTNSTGISTSAVPTTEPPKFLFGGFNAGEQQKSQNVFGASTSTNNVTTTARSSPVPFAFGQNQNQNATTGSLFSSQSTTQSQFGAPTTGFSTFGDQSKATTGFGSIAPAASGFGEQPKPITFGNAPSSNPTSGFGFGQAVSSAPSWTPGAAQPNSTVAPTSGFSFGDQSKTQSSVFGVPNGNAAAPMQNSTAGFTFGQTSTSASGWPQQNNTQPAAPPASTGGFSFGDASKPLTFGAQAPNTNGPAVPAAFSFGQQQQPASNMPTFGGGFPSGQQQQPQPLFTAQAPQQNMFSVGATAAAPRRSQIRARRLR